MGERYINHSLCLEGEKCEAWGCKHHNLGAGGGFSAEGTARSSFNQNLRGKWSSAPTVAEELSIFLALVLVCFSRV